MENPFEMILERLTAIENLLKTIMKTVKVDEREKNTEILNIDQASEYLSLSKTTIYGKIATRVIPHFKKDKRLYFTKSELDIY